VINVINFTNILIIHVLGLLQNAQKKPVRLSYPFFGFSYWPETMKAAAQRDAILNALLLFV